MSNTDIFIYNINKLNETELEILEYVTNKDKSWFCDKYNVSWFTDKLDLLHNKFSLYCTHKNGKAHPFFKAYEKIIKNIKLGALILQTDVYSKEYEKLAISVNRLFSNPKTHYQVVDMLKTFVREYFDEICNTFSIPIEVCITDMQDNWMIYTECISSVLDENDLKRIINFSNKTNIV